MFFIAHSSGTLSGVLLLLIVLISLGYYVYIQFKVSQPKLLKCLSFLFAFFAIYGFVHILSNEVIQSVSGFTINHSDYIKKIAISLLPVYPFYYFARKGQLTTSIILKFLPIFLLLCIYTYYQRYNSLLALAIEVGSSATEFTNNSGYLFLSLLPIIFLCTKRDIIQMLYILITLVFIVMAVKRGAIVICILCLLYYFFFKFFKEKQKSKAKNFFIIATILVIGGNFVADYISQSEYFVYRLENTLEGNASGRDDIYSEIWNVFIHFNFIELLFGSGANSSIFYTGHYAHNDWLEILVNQGAIGVTIYLVYFITMFNEWKRNRELKDVNLCLTALFIILFMKTLFSMSYTGYTLFICIAYGYCMAYINQSSKSKHVHEFTR